MNEQDYKKYAELIVVKGVALYEGQCLEIVCGRRHYDFALQVAESAYKKGAKFVEIKVISNELTRTRVEHAKGDLEYVPDYRRAEIYEKLTNDWAFLRIANTEEGDLLAGVNPERLKEIDRALRLVMAPYGKAVSLNKMVWSAVAVPGPEWAAKIFKEGASDELLQRLSEHIKRIVRLDSDSPIEAWDANITAIEERCTRLTELNLDRVIFKSNETNLEVGLIEGSRWIGGNDITIDGRTYAPNIPTEECFVTPDYRRAEGKVVVTRPLEVMGSVVEGAWFEFKEGKVVASGAKKGADLLENFLSIDEGARMLGEVALVDKSSPIYQSGLLFHNILYDENAACHIALGRGYLFCLPDFRSLLTDEQKREAGCNLSLVHTDFMIGSDTLDVIGVDKEGREIELIKRGSFQL